MDQRIVESLKRLGMKADRQEQSKQIVSSFSHNGFDYPVFIRELDGGNLLQVLAFVPCTLQKEAVQDTSRLLHMVNKELDMPGFCCDEESNTVFYRVVIPFTNKNFDEMLFCAYLNATQQICGMFGTVIQAIAVNAMTLEEMLKEAHEGRARKLKAQENVQKQ